MLECRLCLQIGPSIYVFDESNSLPEKIWDCCGLMVVQNDGLPIQICFSCEIKLNTFTEFRHMCIQNEIVLKQRSKEINSEIEERKVSLDIYDRSDVIDNIDVFQDSDRDDTVKNIISPHESDTAWFECLTKGFSNDSILAENSKKNDMCIAKKYRCNECGKVLSSLSSLQNHIKGMHKNHNDTEDVSENIPKLVLIKREIENEQSMDTAISPENDILKRNPKEIEIETSDNFKREDINEFDSTTVESINVQARHSLCNVGVSIQSHVANQYRLLQKNRIRNISSCNICGKIYQSEKTRDNHIKRIHEVKLRHTSKSLQCDKCDYSTESKYRLRIHIENHHSDAANVQCNMCGKTFKTGKNCANHIKRIHESAKKTFECDVCKKIFYQKNKISDHLKRHMNLMKKISCDRCDFKTEDKSKLRRHIVVKHLNIGNYQCDICKKVLNSEKHLNYHVKRVHEDKRDMFKCDICHKILSNKNVYSKHLKRHMNPIVKFPCDKCDFIAASNVKLLQHIDDRHLHHPCDVCGKVFRSKKHYNSHSKRVHQQRTKIFECDMCSKTFSMRRGITEHLQRHMNLKKKYPCDRCDYKAECKYHLLRHIERKHLNIRSHQCSFCGKLFKSLRSCKIHAMVHDNNMPLQCDYCGKRFKHKSSLLTHIFIHMGIKPHKCQYCFKRFTDISTLKTHIFQHTGETPFSCDLCQKGFKQRSNLKSHLKHFHKQS